MEVEVRVEWGIGGVGATSSSGPRRCEIVVEDLCAGFSAAVSDTLVPRAMAALAGTGYRKLAVAGGVAMRMRRARVAV